MTDSGRTRSEVACFAFLDVAKAVSEVVCGAMNADEPDSKAVSIKRISIADEQG